MIYTENTFRAISFKTVQHLLGNVFNSKLIDTMIRIYEVACITTRPGPLPLYYDQEYGDDSAERLAQQTSPIFDSVKHTDQEDIAFAYTIISLVDFITSHLKTDKSPLNENLVLAYLNYGCSLIKLNHPDMWKLVQFIPKIFIEVSDSLKDRRPAFDDTLELSDQQLIYGKNDFLAFYDTKKPMFIINGREIRRVGEYQFAMLVNLAARRQANIPKNGLTHKGEHLKDDPPEYKNYGKLQEQLSKHGLTDILQSHRSDEGKRIGDGFVYLDIPRNNIIIDHSIRLFKSCHRKILINKLNTILKPEVNPDEIQELKRYIEMEHRRLKRNESLIDDAISKLKVGNRPKDLLLDLRRIDRRVGDMLE